MSATAAVGADRALDAGAVLVKVGGHHLVEVVIERLVRARSPGRAVVDEAVRRNSEIIVMGAPRGEHHRGVFSETVDFVLKHGPCRVMVAAGRKAA